MNAEPTDNKPNLFDLVKSSLEPSQELSDINPKELRYCLYARKSTESTDRQARSIGDQIKDCYKYVIEPSEIYIRRTDIIKEEKSAKEAGTRPAFRKMIEDIESGKYDGLISWHPDRIARNMKEAGEIIDLIDRGILKDLRFAKAQFDNTPSGKMLLGITFVLSKHYSEHLSESVQRGVHSITQQGGVLRHLVHGYKVLHKKLVADGENYLLIEQAFRMRMNHKSLEEIADFLNDKGYQAYRKNTGHYVYKFNVKKLSVMMRNPIYAGIYVFGSQVVKYGEYDEDFTPMITEEEFLQIHGEKSFLAHTFSHGIRVSPEAKSDFLRRMVICADCKRYMTTSITHKKAKGAKTYYFYFRCETKHCPAYGSGPRGRTVIDYVINFLQNHQFTTQANYDRYKQDTEEANKLSISSLQSTIGRLTKLLGDKRKQYDDVKIMAADKTSGYSEFYTPKDLKVLKQEVIEIEAELTKKRGQLKEQSGAVMSFAEYLELFENTTNYLCNTTSMIAADEIIRIFFSNFTAKGELAPPNYKQKQWSINNHCLAKPFDEFVKNGDFLNGRGERT